MEDYLSDNLKESGIYEKMMELLFFHIVQLSKVNKSNSIWIMNGKNRCFDGLIDKRAILLSILGNSKEMHNELYCCISDFGNEVYIKSKAERPGGTFCIDETFHAKYYPNIYGSIAIGESTLEHIKSYNGFIIEHYIGRANSDKVLVWDNYVANDWDYISKPDTKPIYYYEDETIKNIFDLTDEIKKKKEL